MKETEGPKRQAKAAPISGLSYLDRTPYLLDTVRYFTIRCKPESLTDYLATILTSKYLDYIRLSNTES